MNTQIDLSPNKSIDSTRDIIQSIIKLENADELPELLKKFKENREKLQRILNEKGKLKISEKLAGEIRNFLKEIEGNKNNLNYFIKINQFMYRDYLKFINDVMSSIFFENKDFYPGFSQESFYLKNTKNSLQNHLLSIKKLLSRGDKKLVMLKNKEYFKKLNLKKLKKELEEKIMKVYAKGEINKGAKKIFRKKVKKEVGNFIDILENVKKGDSSLASVKPAGIDLSRFIGSVTKDDIGEIIEIISCVDQFLPKTEEKDMQQKNSTKKRGGKFYHLRRKQLKNEKPLHLRQS